MPITLQQNVSLKPYNTLAVDVRAHYLTEFKSIEQLLQITELNIWGEQPHLILGQGSNVLLTTDVSGIVLINRIPGIEVLKQDSEHVWVKVGAGVNWHQFVLHAIDKGWAGIENLSLIPGTVGAAPIQNIGAYGVELADVFETLSAFDLRDKKVISFSKQDCAFHYRDSIFKQSLKNQCVILDVTLKLNLTPHFKLDYGDLRHTLDAMQLNHITLKSVSDAVIQIRNSKLPNPKELPNAGSFFKNPIITADEFEILQQRFPEIPHYPAHDNQIKIPAGWLIEQCNWKGKRIRDAGTHQQHALVVVNYGSANGADLLAVVKTIQSDVEHRFNISLQPEVNIMAN